MAYGNEREVSAWQVMIVGEWRQEENAYRNAKECENEDVGEEDKRYPKH